jgi:FixJ family two-component response regulator
MVRGKVIVVDDDAPVRRALQRLIRSAGYDVEVLEDAEAFLSHDVVEPPACLVLDLRMPGMSGLDLLNAIAGTPRSLPIVFITGHGDAEARSEALGAGAVDVLDKPLEQMALLQAIEQALSQPPPPSEP